MKIIRKFQSNIDPQQTVNSSHNRSGFMLMVACLTGAAFIIIPTCIAFLGFGSYGIYKSIHNKKYQKTDKDILYETEILLNSIKEQFNPSFSIVKKNNAKPDMISEATLEQLAQALSANHEMSETLNDIQDAQEAIQDFSSSLNKLQSRKHNGKKYSKTIADLSSQINYISSELSKLNNIVVHHVQYFKAYNLEQQVCQLCNFELTGETMGKNPKKLNQKNLTSHATALEKARKTITCYPELQQRITLLDKQIKNQLLVKVA